ncbi:MAG TPA: acyl-ACP desaturase [Candidatus Binataceae bacterium]|nr:acyl-ACP desaturase [Candidatus Binataceae bacterium]
MTESINRGAYRVYLDFLETAERKRRWNIFDDVPWDRLDAATTTEGSAQCVEIFCAEELYLPDYSAKGLELVRSRFGMAWFQTCWAFEESRHGLVFREYLTRSGLRSEAEVEALEASVFAKTWTLPFETWRQMACYGALQEAVTYVAYRLQRDKARSAGDTVLETIFHLVGRDEAAHAGFYRAIIGLELAQDRAATIADLAHVLSCFKMPGDGLIADYQQRLRTSGSGISPRAFIERVVSPLLIALQISRREFKQALGTRRADTRIDSAAAP